MAKRNSQLVCQHLENISGKMLEDYQEVLFPSRPRPTKPVGKPKKHGPALARYVDQVTALRGRHKGKTLRAWVVKTTGQVRFNGRRHNSPSAAAAAASRGCVNSLVGRRPGPEVDELLHQGLGQVRDWREPQDHG